ncbi:hypothetical protein GPJ56_000961 [Histomonas meleagridis]|uniref:uncharacterized protein n=1 Tax=Histomonas meleagridis TaxID=135588 RepID=UPI003559D28F|nr:hypothetical protein GPJ56_000961 [Histomonas meleagridis]KAH0803796.1 hypothetical protein GO595_002626 [Histomonas meleagridis]
MDALPPEYQAIITDLLQEYVDQISDLQAQLRAYQAGNQFSQNDYYKLEMDLRTERDNNAQLSRKLQESETARKMQDSKIQQFELQIQRLNIDANQVLLEKKRMQDIIDNQQKQIQNSKSGNEASKLQISQFTNEKKAMREIQHALEKQNNELSSAVELLLAREQELTKALQERIQSNSEIESNFSALQAKCTKYEREITRLKKQNNEITTQIDINQNVTQQNTLTFESIHDELDALKRQNEELKEKVTNLEEEALRAQRLQSALETRNKNIEALQQQISEKDEIILSFNRAKGELIQQVETYRQRVESRAKGNDKEIVKLRDQVERFRELNLTSQRRIQDLESILKQSSQEVEELRKQKESIENGTYGLPQAINELKEVRAMVDVRDKQIADLVSNLNSMDKIMMGLCGKLNINFNLEEFLEKFNSDELKNQKLRTQKAEEDLRNKMELMKKRGAVGEIKVVLNNDQRPIKTTIYENDTNNNEKSVIHKVSNATKAFRQRYQYNNNNEGDDENEGSIILPADQLHKKGQQRFKINRSNETHQINLHKKPETKTNANTKTNTNSKSKIVKNEKIITKKDEICQTDEKIVLEKPSKDAKDDRDEWIINLNNKYIQTQQERDEWKRKYEQLTKQKQNKKFVTETTQSIDLNDTNNDSTIEITVMSNSTLSDIKSNETIAETDNKTKEKIKNNNSKVINDKNNKTKEKIADKAKESIQNNNKTKENVTSKTITIADKSNNDKISNKVKLADMSTQSVPVSLSLSDIISPSIATHNDIVLTLCNPPNSVILSPDAKAQEIFNARNNALKNELLQIQHESIENKHKCETLQEKLQQNETIITKLQNTIDNLEAELSKQRDKYKERLKQVKIDAYKYAKSKLKEEIELNNITATNNNIKNNKTNENELNEISKHITKLNQEKNSLQMELEEERENVLLLQNQTEQYRIRLKATENELNDMRNQMLRTNTTLRVNEFNAEMRTRMKILNDKNVKLREKVKELTTKLKEMQENNTNNENENNWKSNEINENENANKDNRRIKSVEAKYMKLQVQNEELQLRLGRANGTIERLNQILQRKEEQLTKLKDIAAKYKHEIIRSRTVKR